MAYLNANIPTITCFIRNEFLFNHEKGHNEFTPADVHSVASIEKRVPLFEAFLDNGVNWTRRPIHAFVWKKDAEVLPLSEHIYWGGNFESLKILLQEKEIKNTEIRFFLGYSGWAKVQLEEEISNNSWFVSENDFENILSADNKTLWKNKLMQKGGAYKIWANAPNDINLN